MKKNNIVEEMTLALRNNMWQELQTAIVAMSDIDARDRDGRTLLINAAFYNCVDIVELLIQRGANVNASDKLGNTALHAAVQEGNLKMMQTLLINGAEVNSRNRFGNTPLWIAKPLQPKEIFALLLSFGADPEIKNNYGVSAHECMRAYPDIIEMFNAAKISK